MKNLFEKTKHAGDTVEMMSRFKGFDIEGIVGYAGQGSSRALRQYHISHKNKAVMKDLVKQLIEQDIGPEEKFKIFSKGSSYCIELSVTRFHSEVEKKNFKTSADEITKKLERISHQKIFHPNTVTNGNTGEIHRNTHQTWDDGKQLGQAIESFLKLPKHSISVGVSNEGAEGYKYKITGQDSKELATLLQNFGHKFLQVGARDNYGQPMFTIHIYADTAKQFLSGKLQLIEQHPVINNNRPSQYQQQPNYQPYSPYQNSFGGGYQPNPDNYPHPLPQPVNNYGNPFLGNQGQQAYPNQYPPHNSQNGFSLSYQHQPAYQPYPGVSQQPSVPFQNSYNNGNGFAGNQVQQAYPNQYPLHNNQNGYNNGNPHANSHSSSAQQNTISPSSLRRQPSGPKLQPEEETREERYEKFLQDGGMICPISQEIFVDPVIAEDSKTYEREAITAWLQRSNKSPVTNEEIGNGVVANKNMLNKVQRAPEEFEKLEKEREQRIKNGQGNLARKEEKRHHSNSNSWNQGI